MRPPRVAVIPTHNRPLELQRCVDAIKSQVDLTVIIDNACDPPINVGHGGVLVIIRDEEQPPNLSRLWNIGIDIARENFEDRGEWDVAVLNDDAVPPVGWFDAVSHAMRSTTALAGCSHPFNALVHGQVQLHDASAGFSVATRLAGWAFMIRGESGLRADERLRWWAADDLISHQARQGGGLVHIGGFPVPNTGADTSTRGELALQAARDMQTFVEIVGCRPW